MEIPRHWRTKDQRIKFINLETNPVKKVGSVAAAISKSAEGLRQSLFGTRLKIMIYEAQPEKYNSLEDIKI